MTEGGRDRPSQLKRGVGGEKSRPGSAYSEKVMLFEETLGVVGKT